MKLNSTLSFFARAKRIVKWFFVKSIYIMIDLWKHWFHGNFAKNCDSKVLLFHHCKKSRGFFVKSINDVIQHTVVSRNFHILCDKSLYVNCKISWIHRFFDIISRNIYVKSKLIYVKVSWISINIVPANTKVLYYYSSQLTFHYFMHANTIVYPK